ncbi:MAG: hypothetical protein HOP11_06570 [Saprospiraceae bacterium]|nr:hypothetical protein [Saprospiraceae bacterium]
MLDNKKKQEILLILGEPDTKPSDNIWTYLLGTRPGFHIDPDVLILYYNSDNSLIKFKILCEGKEECKY